MITIIHNGVQIEIPKGFTVHDGGPSLLKRDQKVDVLFEDGLISYGDTSGFWSGCPSDLVPQDWWHWDGHDVDEGIIAYRKSTIIPDRKPDAYVNVYDLGDEGVKNGLGWETREGADRNQQSLTDSRRMCVLRVYKKT